MVERKCIELLAQRQALLSGSVPQSHACDPRTRERCLPPVAPCSKLPATAVRRNMLDAIRLRLLIVRQLTGWTYVELVTQRVKLYRTGLTSSVDVSGLLIVCGPVWAGQMLSTSPARGSPLSMRRILRFIRLLHHRFLLGLLFANW